MKVLYNNHFFSQIKTKLSLFLILGIFAILGNSCNRHKLQEITDEQAQQILDQLTQEELSTQQLKQENIQKEKERLEKERLEKEKKNLQNTVEQKPEEPKVNDPKKEDQKKENPKKDNDDNPAPKSMIDSLLAIGEDIVGASENSVLSSHAVMAVFKLLHENIVTEPLGDLLTKNAPLIKEEIQRFFNSDFEKLGYDLNDTEKITSKIYAFFKDLKAEMKQSSSSILVENSPTTADALNQIIEKETNLQGFVNVLHPNCEAVFLAIIKCQLQWMEDFDDNSCTKEMTRKKQEFKISTNANHETDFLNATFSTKKVKIRDNEFAVLPAQDGYAVVIGINTDSTSINYYKAPKITEESLQQLLSTESKSVNITLPAFHIKQETNLIEKLKAKLPNTFGGQFFSTKFNDNVKVQTFCQMAEIELTEEGCVAQAVGFAQLVSKGMVSNPEKFIADHPLSYAVVKLSKDKKSVENVLFQGKYVKPE